MFLCELTDRIHLTDCSSTSVSEITSVVFSLRYFIPTPGVKKSPWEQLLSYKSTPFSEGRQAQYNFDRVSFPESVFITL